MDSEPKEELDIYERKGEALGDISSMLRRLVESGNCSQEYPCGAFSSSSNALATWVSCLADRIDAAAKNMRSMLDGNIARVRELEAMLDGAANTVLGCAIKQKESSSGNAAAMRKELKELDLDAHRMRWDGKFRDKREAENFVERVIDTIRRALRAPARNCDVGTAEEQAERHGRFCAAHYKADAVDAQCFGCPASDKKETDCEFVWGQLPFAPEKEPAK